MSFFQLAKQKCPRCGLREIQWDWFESANVIRNPIGFVMTCLLGRSVISLGFRCKACGESFLAEQVRK